MNRRLVTAVVMAGLCVTCPTGSAETPQDSDGDGIWDGHEELLGCDPQRPDLFAVVLQDGVESEERRVQAGYDDSKDFKAVEFCHAGGDRYLWRVSLANSPRLEDTVLHLYVDADADASTGRKGAETAASTGTECMLSVVGGQGTSSYYTTDGNRVPGPLVTFAVQDASVILSTDIDLARTDAGVHFGLYVLCHTVTSAGEGPRMTDSSGKHTIAAKLVSDQQKIIRPRDHRECYLVDATFGHQRLLEILANDRVTIVPHDQLQLDGFAIDTQGTRRWPAVRRQATNGSVGTTVRKPGRYHIGFMMYDDSRDDRVGFFVDGQLKGIAVANRDDNQTWMYWLREPLDLRGGERVVLKALGDGNHGICNVLFLPDPPDVRELQFEAQNLVAADATDGTQDVIISWTTTRPSTARFEYGTDTNYGMTISTDGVCLVHRVVLSGLDRKKEYHGCAVGIAADGTETRSRDFVFRPAATPLPSTRSGTASIPIHVHNEHAFPVRRYPVTTGVPFPKGSLGSIDSVRLKDAQNNVPAQFQLLARWPDQSVKWLLVTFLVNADAGETRQYQLEFGADVTREPVPAGVEIVDHSNGVVVDTQALRFRIDRSGNVTDIESAGAGLLNENATCHTEAIDAEGVAYSTEHGDAEITVEERGPLRVVVKVVSHLRAADGGQFLRVEKRIMAYHGAAFLRIHHTLVVQGSEPFTNMDRLDYRVPVVGAGSPWRVATAGGEMELAEGSSSVVQRFDNQLVRLTAEGSETADGRLVGSLISREGNVALAVRDCWQNYPKAFSKDSDRVVIELCPDFEPGLYDSFPFEKEGHQLYYYLLNGHYRLKRGVSKTHEMLLCFEPHEVSTSICSLFQRPLLATADPTWMCQSKAFYDIAPRNPDRFPLYERAIDKNLKAYVERRDRQRDYGMLNFGDWYGERGTNWGNVEYDTQHAFFLEYARSGNANAFFLGEATQLHNRDVDTVQWSADPRDLGAVYVHQMCHVGDYYDQPVPGSLGFPRGGFTVSHAWTEGHFDHYFLTGDRRSRETGCAVADFFIRKDLARPYDFSTCRTPGWHLIMLAATYAATGDPYYLNASKVLVERVLETQDKTPRPLPPFHAAGRQPYQLGGWSRMMVPGHCLCEPRHRGNAGFMVAVLLSGLKYYHDVTEDPRVKEAIIAGAHYLLDECYSDEVKGFRYTSCPETEYRAGASPLMVEGIARAYLWTRDDRFRRVLVESLPIAAGGSGYGKGFSMYYRMAPRLLADLEAVGLTLE